MYYCFCSFLNFFAKKLIDMALLNLHCYLISSHFCVSYTSCKFACLVVKHHVYSNISINNILRYILGQVRDDTNKHCIKNATKCTINWKFEKRLMTIIQINTIRCKKLSFLHSKLFPFDDIYFQNVH